MKSLFLILLLSIPCLGNTTALSPTSVGTNAPIVFYPSLKSKPSETGFLKKIAGKILQKRIYKAVKSLGRAKGDDGKGLSIIGLIFGLLGIPLLIFAVKMEIVALVLASLLLGLSGLVLCQIGLDRANALDQSLSWVKLLAYTGLGLNLLLSIASGGALFLFLAFGGQG